METLLGVRTYEIADIDALTAEGGHFVDCNGVVVDPEKVDARRAKNLAVALGYQSWRSAELAGYYVWELADGRWGAVPDDGREGDRYALETDTDRQDAL
jgi:hypothetical protein